MFTLNLHDPSSGPVHMSTFDTSARSHRLKNCEINRVYDNRFYAEILCAFRDAAMMLPSKVLSLRAVILLIVHRSCSLISILFVVVFLRQLQN